jgi:solute carrier family 35 protein F5
LGALTGIEHVSVLRISAVLASLLGVILVVYAPIHQERKEMPHQLFGQMLALLGAFFYGCYSILLKRNIHHERDTTLFFGLVGLFNMLGLWPVLVMLDRWQIESWHWPSTVTTWALIISNALLGTFLSDYLWLLAILLVSIIIV